MTARKPFSPRDERDPLRALAEAVERQVGRPEGPHDRRRVVRGRRFAPGHRRFERGTVPLDALQRALRAHRRGPGSPLPR